MAAAAQVRTHRLTTEIAIATAALLSQLDDRRAHPGYGNRKSEIVAAYYRLEGLVFGWLYVTGTWTRAASVLLTEPTYELIRANLGLDLADLRKQALNA